MTTVTTCWSEVETVTGFRSRGIHENTLLEIRYNSYTTITWRYLTHLLRLIIYVPRENRVAQIFFKRTSNNYFIYVFGCSLLEKKKKNPFHLIVFDNSKARRSLYSTLSRRIVGTPLFARHTRDRALFTKKKKKKFYPLLSRFERRPCLLRLFRRHPVQQRAYRYGVQQRRNRRERERGGIYSGNRSRDFHKYVNIHNRRTDLSVIRVVCVL